MEGDQLTQLKGSAVECGSAEKILKYTAVEAAKFPSSFFTTL